MVPSAVAARADGPVLTGRSISKSYGAVAALDDVGIELWPGEIHVLAGENGSGKSTLLRCLSGGLQPDTGYITLDGAPVVLPDIRHAVNLGVTRISQELSLAPDLSAAENIFMGHARGPFSVLRRAVVNRDAEAILRALGSDLDVRVRARFLQADQRQLVEIARALSFQSRVLLLDEPTASLDAQESASLFAVVRGLADSGVAVVFISHRLPEMLEVGDRFTVLRDGRLTGTGVRGEVDDAWLIQRMVGREVSFDRRVAAASSTGRTVLEVGGLRDTGGRLSGADLRVARGEVVGVSGLVGAGKTELLELIAGVRPRATGSVSVGDVAVAGNVRSARAAGVALVPEDRKSQGIVPGMSIRENVMLGPRAAGLAPISSRREAARAQEWCQRLRINSPVTTPVSALSGGNQQKVVIARNLNQEPKVLLLDEPTRGVDIGAKAEIYELIESLADQGVTVLIASSELTEILAVSTRVLVMHAGAVVADLPAAGLSEESIIALATGVEQ